MVEISKHLFDETFCDVSCDVITHPWKQGCIASMPLTYYNSAIGSAKFYSIVYLAQALMRGRKLAKKEEWKKMAEYYIRSTVLGLCVTGTCANMGCLFSTLNGLFIYLEPPGRRGLVINLFCNLFIEYWMRTFERDGRIKITNSMMTLMFMVGSAFLFYLMRLEGDKEQRTQLFWLYTPEKVRRKSDELENICPHNGGCIEYIAKGFSSYFGVGAAITLARLILPQIRTPVRALSSVRTKHFKMAMFFGSYIGIYRAVICYLCRRQGRDSAMFALPAGYLAGLSFLFNPNLGISIASVTAALKLYSTILYEKKILPERIPLPELLYCICQGTLFHARMMHPEVCPNYMFNLMKSVSNGCTDIIYKNMLEEIKKAAL